MAPCEGYMKSITKPRIHELVKSHFMLPVTLSGAKQENFPSLLHSVERIIVGHNMIDGLKSCTNLVPKVSLLPNTSGTRLSLHASVFLSAFGSYQLIGILIGSLCR